MSKFKSAEAANKTPSTIVEVKRVFSNPRRVWKPDEKLSAPNAPPNDAPVRCKITLTMMSIESTICTYGSACWRRSMWQNPNKNRPRGQLRPQIASRRLAMYNLPVAGRDIRLSSRIIYIKSFIYGKKDQKNSNKKD